MGCFELELGFDNGLTLVLELEVEVNIADLEGGWSVVLSELLNGLERQVRQRESDRHAKYDAEEI